jgi:citrate lyase beta subunit
MIKTYFFVPLTKHKYIQKAQTLKTDHIVYDLEDAISGSSFETAHDNLKLIENTGSCFLRPKINWSEFNYAYLDDLVNQGFDHFVIPKAESFEHVKKLIDWSGQKSSGIKFILLVENPSLLFDLQNILKSFDGQVIGLSLGSHDYCSFINARYNYEAYSFAYDFVLNLAKSFSIEAIDTASMEIENKSGFTTEVKRGFDKGYRSKFILHPKQLEYLEEIELFSGEEIAFAKYVAAKINIDDFNAVKIDGRVLEKPHIQRIKEILKYIDYGLDKHR